MHIPQNSATKRATNIDERFHRIVTYIAFSSEVIQFVQMIFVSYISSHFDSLTSCYYPIVTLCCFACITLPCFSVFQHFFTLSVARFYHRNLFRWWIYRCVPTPSISFSPYHLFCHGVCAIPPQCSSSLFSFIQRQAITVLYALQPNIILPLGIGMVLYLNFWSFSQRSIRNTHTQMLEISLLKIIWKMYFRLFVLFSLRAMF